MKRAVRAKAEEIAARARERLLGRATGAAAAPAAPAEGPAFRSGIPWMKERRAGALVIICSSSRFLSQTAEFLSKGLHMPAYDLVAIPGGIQWLALPDLLPKHNTVARWMTKYLIRRHRLARVVCVAHEGCGAYEDESVIGALAHLATGKSTSEHQIQQLLKVGRELTEMFQVSVELYYASVADDAIVFRKVEEPPKPT